MRAGEAKRPIVWSRMTGVGPFTATWRMEPRKKKYPDESPDDCRGGRAVSIRPRRVIYRPKTTQLELCTHAWQRLGVVSVTTRPVSWFRGGPGRRDPFRTKACPACGSWSDRPVNCRPPAGMGFGGMFRYNILGFRVCRPPC